MVEAKHSVQQAEETGGGEGASPSHHARPSRSWGSKKANLGNRKFTWMQETNEESRTVRFYIATRIEHQDTHRLVTCAVAISTKEARPNKRREREPSEE
jgi:hypothetical protein